MNFSLHPYQIYPLGDAAITVDFGNFIDIEINKEVISRFHQLQQDPLPGMIEVIPAYSSFTIYYDLVSVRKKIPFHISAFEWMQDQLKIYLEQTFKLNEEKKRIIEIPVCYDYEFSPDINYLCETKNISVEEVIQLHAFREYRVFMLGFLPGFAYMGKVDERISIPRKSQPVHVSPGSVGVAGDQTGIYPVASPGGWQIIGRTPLKLFDANKQKPALFTAGDHVHFVPISKQVYYEIENSSNINIGGGV